MSRPVTFSSVLLAAVMSPAMALAAEPGVSGILSVPPISLIVALIGLGVAIVLLVEALLVRRVAMGGVIADKIGLVVLAIVCLAASAVANWLVNFSDGVTLDQMRFASDVLVIAAMALLLAYFSGVRRGFQCYLESVQEAIDAPTSSVIDGSAE